MAQVVTDLDSAVDKLNALYNGSSSAPASGEEDYLVWTDLLNIGVNIWEFEEGQNWLQLFIELADAADGDKATDGTTSYTLPTLFAFPNSGYVWIGSSTNKTAYQVIDIRDKQIYENNKERWCYFTPTTLEFNPNLTIDTGSTISYNFYKKATAVSAGADLFEMEDPMFAVYYALSELKKEEGDTSALTIASQKLAAMVTKNEAAAEHQNSQLVNPVGDGFGI